MDSKESGEPEGVLTTQDVSLLRSLELKRLGRRFAVDWFLFALVLAGARIASSGDWRALWGPENLVGGVLVATLSAVGHIALSRRLLGRTSEETRLQMGRDWQALTDPGWPARLIGVSAGASAFFAVFSLALVALLEPIPGVWEVMTEGLKIFGMGLVVLVPAATLVRSALLKGLRREVQGAVGTAVPGLGASGPLGPRASTEDP